MKAISKYCNNYANFKGITTRREYFITILLLIIPIFLIFANIMIPPLVMKSTTLNVSVIISCILSLVYILLNIIPFLAMTWRRLHDAGYTGVFALNIFVPLGIIVLIGFLCLPTQKESNSYRITWENIQTIKQTKI